MATKVKFTKVAKESSLPATSDSEDQAGSLYFVTETGNIYLDGYNTRHKMTPEYDLTLEDNNLKFTETKGEQTNTSYISLAGTSGTNYVVGGNLGIEGDVVYIEKNIDAGLTDLNEGDHTVMVNSEYLPLTSSNSTTGTVIVGGNGTQPNLSEGTNATVVGANTSFSATNNTVVGTQASATGDNASAIGAQSEATGVNSVALGYGSKAENDNIVSVGNNDETLLRRITGVYPATRNDDGLELADTSDSTEGYSLFDAATRYDLEQARVQPGDGLTTDYHTTTYSPGEALNPTDTPVSTVTPVVSVNYDNSTIGIDSYNQLAVIKDYADKSHTHTKDEITDLPTGKDGVSVTGSDTFYKFVEGDSPATPDTPTAKTGTPEGWYTNETDAVDNENLLTVDYENSYVTSIYTSSFAKEASSEDGGHYMYAITTGSDCTTWGGGVHNVGTGIHVPYGKTLCVSCEVYSDVATTWAMDVNNYAVGADNWKSNDNDEVAKRTASGAEIPAGQWTRIWFTYSNTSSLNTTKCELYDNSNWGVTVAGVSYKMRRIKYELSSEPTPYGIDLAKTSGAIFRTIRTKLSDGTALWTTPTVVASFTFAQKAYKTATEAAEKWEDFDDAIEESNDLYNTNYETPYDAISGMCEDIAANKHAIKAATRSKTSGTLSSLFSYEFPYYSKTFNSTGTTKSITSSSETAVFDVLQEYFAYDTSTLMALVYWYCGTGSANTMDWLLPITETKSKTSATLKYLLPGYYQAAYQPWLMYIIVNISYKNTTYTVESKGMLLNTSDGVMNGNTYLSGFAVK